MFEKHTLFHVSVLYIFQCTIPLFLINLVKLLSLVIYMC